MVSTTGLLTNIPLGFNKVNLYHGDLFVVVNYSWSVSTSTKWFNLYRYDLQRGLCGCFRYIHSTCGSVT